MPEYLAPGVYVEEVDTGNKPIEGVSTSTVGLVGVTERGPVNVPILITSPGDFSRSFGGRLPIGEFSNAGRSHGYLPYAVEGFFTNGGKRSYITRVVPEDATQAERQLFDRGNDLSAASQLIRAVAQGTGTAVNQPLLYVLDAGSYNIGDWVRVGEGSRAEYRQIASTTAASFHVALNVPLSFAHASGVVVNEIAGPLALDAAYAAGVGVFSLADDAVAGSDEVILDIANATDRTVFTTLLDGGGSQLLEIGNSSAVAEFRYAIAYRDLGSNQYRVELDGRLSLDYASGDSVTTRELSAAVNTSAVNVSANSGDLVLYIDVPAGAADFTNRANLLEIDTGSFREIRRIGELSQLDLDLGAYEDYGQNAVVQRINLDDDDRAVATAAGPANTASAFDLDRVDGLAAGMSISVGADSGIIQSVDVAASRITLQAALAGGVPADATAVLLAGTALNGAVAAGTRVLALDSRLGLAAGDVLRLGTAPDEEYVEIEELSGSRGVAPDAGRIVLTAPLRQAHADGTPVRRQHPPTVDTSIQAALLFLTASEDANLLYVNDGDSYAANDLLRVRLASGEVYYHRLDANATPLTPGELELDAPLTASHEMGLAVVGRDPLIQVVALDPGDWGNRLRLSVEDETSGLASGAQVTEMNLSPDPTLVSTLRATSLTGIEAGTLLEFVQPDGTVLSPVVKVQRIDRSANNLVILDPDTLQAAHVTAHDAAILAGQRLTLRSREFRLSVQLLRRPDAAVPSRNDTVIDSELFRHLSMDTRHSRYLHRIIGTTWTPGNAEDDDGIALRRSDRRSEGQSAYIRVRDLAATPALTESIRLGPEALLDLLPSGLQRPAKHALSGGDDSISTMSDAMYLGVDDIEPELRTGLFSLSNIEQISLVAAPGQTTPTVQQALIDHCENLRYRFAVLDAQGPGTDTLADVQFQRQQFDSKYAALYHPWVLVPDPMPSNLASIAQVGLPPSGHVLGLIARTDIERGVHKAPANEVLRGITGLTRSLNKGEHDILNPSPVNINVIRDFRINNRGIRVWGARCITSDSDYKYVNVRRLMIFLEHSIDRGLQWVVFEPNAEPLWARVRRAISNFLTVVWRNGALEGLTAEQAFFVKCDRTTMTQNDIDNGRLICVIGVAPVKPAEYVIVRIGLWTANAEQD